MDFKDFKSTNGKYITTLNTEYYPDYLEEAESLYGEHINDFIDLAKSAKSSSDLLKSITFSKFSTKKRIQILRIFRKYVSPNTSVEMLKQVKKLDVIIRDFGSGFRKIDEVVKAIDSRKNPDYALMAILYEYKDRGLKGYMLTERFFNWFKQKFPDFKIIGPESAGKDLQLKDHLKDFGSHNAPTDFIIKDTSDKVLAVGYARYDSDRGGAQEDDRIGGNRDKISQVMMHNKKTNSNVKIIFLNDGPGLVLGSMWDDYAELEEYGKGIARVVTLKMLDTRLTKKWMEEEI